jgi:PGF-CTERM protein
VAHAKDMMCVDRDDPQGFKTSGKYGSLKPGESRTLQYTIESGDTGKFDLGQATATYADEEGKYHTVNSNSPMVEVLSPLEKPEIPTGEEGEKNEMPGFEVAFALAGLLAVVYLFRRKNERQKI